MPVPDAARSDLNKPSAQAFLAALGAWLYIPVLYAGLCLLLLRLNYPLFHTMAEFGSILLGGVALLVALMSTRFTRNYYITFISIGLGWSALFDLAHTLVYEGMNLLPLSGSNLAVQLWLVARFLQALSLLIAGHFLRRSMPLWQMQGIYIAYASVVLVLFGSGYFPVAYAEGGLTTFKINAEYLIIFMLGLAGLQLYRNRSLLSPTSFQCMLVAVSLLIVSELMFTRYVSLFDAANAIGHVLKIFASWYIFRALVQTTLQEPFSMLSKTASSYDAVPDPAILVDARGLVLQVNQAGVEYAGLPLEKVAGHSIHLFHDPEVSAGACPLCSASTQWTAGLELGLKRLGRQYRCHIVPFDSVQMPGASVHLIHDVTEQQRMAAEREQLVLSLRERVKELTCLHNLARLEENLRLDQKEYLAAVAVELPKALLYDQRATAWIESVWGNFGLAPDVASIHVLTQPLLEQEQNKGMLYVGYPADIPVSGEILLQEERALMTTAAQRINNMLTRIYQRQRIMRLSFLYEMLSATNKAIVHCKTGESLLEALFHILGQKDFFATIVIATSSQDDKRYAVPYASGLSPQAGSELIEYLQQSAQLAGEDQRSLRFRALPVPAAAVAGTWAAELAEAGIGQLGILPLRTGGNQMGVVVLGLADSRMFENGTSQLLEEMGAELAFAFEAMVESDRRKLAESRADLSEKKFRAIFEFAPVPMLIMTPSGQELKYANRAMYAWVGYQEGDITNVEQWFEKVFDDPQQLEMVRTLWVQSVTAAHTKGSVFDYPEVRLRCNDGTHVIGKSRMTVVESDIIMTWSDMTEIRRNEARLQESEQRFRAMIEQTLTPIFVRAEGRFIYVNPSMAALMGYGAEELLGIDPMKFAAMEAAEMEEIQKFRHPAPGATSQYNFRVRRKDGTVVDLWIHLSNITWDNKVAYIGIAEDVTERRKMETELQHSHDLLQKLSQQVPGVIYQFQLNPDGHSSFPFASEHIREIYEVSPDEVKTDAAKVFARLHPEDRKGVEDSIMESARTLQQWKHDYRVMLPSQGVRWRSGNSQPEKLPDGSVLWHGYIDDSTQRKEAEASLSRHAQELERAMQGTLEVMSRMIDLRDPYTAGHQLHVARIARDIGLELGMSGLDAGLLEQMGLVHDIGKISVPAEILNKPTRLSAAEMGIVRGHAQAGYDILKDVSLTVKFAQAILQHHERLDGSGYPAGLKEGQILLEARILAVADVVESMVSHRPYRPAHSVSEALAEVEAGSGKIYDATVVAALVNMVRSKAYPLP